MGTKYNVDEVTGDITTAGDMTAAGDVSGDNVIVAQSPTLASHATRKDYVDNRINGLDWQESVIQFYDPTGSLPGGPSNGDRYISIATANGWTNNYIYEYSTLITNWIEIVPDAYTTCFDENTAKAYTWNGAAWVTMSATMLHNNLGSIDGGAVGEYYHLIQTDYNALVDVNAQLSALHTDGYPTFTGADLADYGGDPAAVASSGQLYVKDDGSADYELFYRDDSGNIVQLTKDGAINPGAISLSILKDADADTKIDVEEGADDDIIRFDVGDQGGGGIADILKIDETNGWIWNEGGDDVDCRWEGTGSVNLLYIDAGNNRVGVGTAAPDTTFQVNGDFKVQGGNFFYYDPVNDGNPYLDFGANAGDALRIRAYYNAGTQVLDYMELATSSTDAGADKGQYKFNVDGTEVVRIDDGGIEIDGSARFEETGDPTNVANTGFVYTKDDGSGNTELFYMDDGGAVVQLTDEGTVNMATSLHGRKRIETVAWGDTGTEPIASTYTLAIGGENYYLDVLEFDTSDQVAFKVVVPYDYKAGTQLKLRTQFASGGTSVGFTFDGWMGLVQDGDVIDTGIPTETFTGTTLTSPGTANELEISEAMVITDGSGEINSVAVQPGDLIIGKIERTDADANNIKIAVMELVW